MANTITNISLSNTFSEWVGTTIQTVNELNSIGLYDWRKGAGTLYIDSVGTALDVANNTFLRGGVSIVGTGSGLTVSKNTEIRGVLSLTNLDAGNPNKLIFSANGVANVNYLNIVGTGLSANVSNNMSIGGTLTVDTIIVDTITNDFIDSISDTANTALPDAKLYTDIQITANGVSTNDVISTANTNLRLYTNAQITANAISANAVITKANTDMKNYVDVANTNLRLYTDSNIVSNNILVFNDTSSASSLYPVFGSITSGTLRFANTSSTKLTFVPSTGTLSATLFTSLSDVTLKENVEKVTNAVDTLKQLNGVSFDWVDNGNKSYGVIAQDVERVLPDVVQTNEEGIKTVNYQALSAFLIEAIKELSNELDQLKNK
jgi:hypothetical protein